MKNLYQRVPSKKRTKILEAAMKEFTMHSYDKASTNQIIREAGISKGLLFHYFTSKKELYLATFDYGTGVFWELFKPHLTDLPTDYFDRLIHISKIKLQICIQEQLLYSFILTSYEDIQHRFPDEFEKLMEETQQIRLPIMFDGIDFSVFRKDIDQQKALHYIYMSFEAMAKEKVKTALRQPDKGLEKWDEMLLEIELLVELFRHGIYRKSE